MKKRIVTLSLVVALAATAIIGGTMAYFTDTKTASNTFTVGNVAIKLDEADVDEYGELLYKTDDSGNVTNELKPRVDGNEYKLVPGLTYVKDPTVTVEKGSEPSYVRMLVKFNKASELIEYLGTDINGTKVFLPQNYIAGWDNTAWISTENIISVGETLIYEFRYKEVVDAREAEKELDALFDTFTLPGTLTNEEVTKLDGLEISVEAHAIQADTFTDADAAWAEFN